MIRLAQTKKKPTKGKRPTKGVEPAQEKKPGKFQKVFFWFIIPLLFASAILLIILQITGTNVFEKAKDLAGITQSADKKGEKNDNYEQQIVSLKSQLQEKDAEIKTMQDQIDEQRARAKKVTIEKKRLNKEIRKLKSAEHDASATIDSLVATYEQMRPKSAAPALVALKDSEAIEIMRRLKTETLAAILEKMSADDAARFTRLLAERTGN